MLGGNPHFGQGEVLCVISTSANVSGMLSLDQMAYQLEREGIHATSAFTVWRTQMERTAERYFESSMDGARRAAGELTIVSQPSQVSR
jgi:hypothetical protein